MKIRHVTNDFEDSVVIEDGDFHLEICSFPGLPGESNLTVGQVDNNGNPIFTKEIAPAELPAFFSALFNFSSAA
ncbi:hypothetical protein ccbrp13_55880 [Ktedonobacteria bacterium brp13]|nr:hypothetical protein ccbrp13_55880 [Ktedonobacteria bacterium brp13]